MNAAELETRHPSVKELASFFDYEHLPANLQRVSKQVHDVAENLLSQLPDSAELLVGLRKLLEAKDYFVRAAKSAEGK